MCTSQSLIIIPSYPVIFHFSNDVLSWGGSCIDGIDSSKSILGSWAMEIDQKYPSLSHDDWQIVGT